MITVKSPSTEQEWKDYYDLRYRVLREPLGKPRGSEQNDGDATGEHFALYDNQILKAIARLDEADERTSQVRFVAVESDAQGRGYGRQIMQAVEERSIKKGHQKMILHARDYAVDFYLSLHYEIIEKSYLLFGVLQHFLMEKKY